MIGAVLAVMMNTASASVLPLALPALSIPITVITVETLETKKQARAKLRKLKNDRLAVCRKGAKAKHDPQRLMTDARINIDERRKLAGLYWTGEDCRQDQGKAIALLDAIVGTDPTASVDIDDVYRLIEYHRQYGPEKSSSRIMDLNRMLWMRGRFWGDYSQLGWDQAGMKAFVLSDPIWSWFEKEPGAPFGFSKNQVTAVKVQTLLDPTSPRFNFEKGLGLAIQHRSFGHIHTAALALEEGKIVPRDPVRAETLLWSNRSWVDTHALLVKRVTPLLSDPDNAVRVKALADMKELAALYTPTTESANEALVSVYAKQLKSTLPGEAIAAQLFLNTLVSKRSPSAKAALIPHIASQLKSKNAEQQSAGRASMANLFWLGDNAVQSLLDEDIKRTGGLVELNTSEGLFFSMTDDDYPRSAIRVEIEGTVSTTVIIGPDGRVMKVENAFGGGPLLDRETAKVASRRTRLKGYDGRYVRAKLPDVLYRLEGCDNNKSKTQSPPNTIVVTGECIIEVTQSLRKY
jgi:Gram-negative bacterial TonB protein C-terminal